MPTISFLILTYNSAKHIDAFFDSFFSHFKQKIEEGEYELVIVDNNSTDSSFDDIKKYSSVQLIHNLVVEVDQSY